MSQSITELHRLPTSQVIRQLLHEKVVAAIHEVLEAELDEFLGTFRYERAPERRGYRHGSIRRRITTEQGPMELDVPRARMQGPEGTEEFHSELLPRYARRTRRVDDAILGTYLAGANTRRIRKALMPLLGERLERRERPTRDRADEEAVDQAREDLVAEQGQAAREVVLDRDVRARGS